MDYFYVDIIYICKEPRNVEKASLIRIFGGVYVMLTGVDTGGKQTRVWVFKSPAANLTWQAGTPGEDDYIISFDVTFKRIWKTHI